MPSKRDAERGGTERLVRWLGIFAFLTIVLSFFLAGASAQTLSPVVETTYGPVRGLVDGDSWAFLGIPYAAPPVAERRWRRPEPPQPWTETLVAEEYGPICPQESSFETRCGSVGRIGDEDCLSVSVWTPDIEASLPVLVHIHGGAFSSGCGRPPSNSGAALASAGQVVVVTIQYRLGSLGFFALDELAGEDPNRSTGNYGLLDQILALQWVRDNIAGFGGNPNDVTVFGESSGGTSVCLLLSSPLTSTLFERAIVESGICGYVLPLHGTNGGLPPNRTAVGRGEELARMVGCDGPNRLECLRALPADELITVPPPATSLLLETAFDTVFHRPAIDDYVVLEQPLVVLRDRKNAGRPLIVGSNKDEMTAFVPDEVLAEASSYEDEVRSRLGDALTDALRPFYPPSDFVQPIDALRAILTDVIFACPSQAVAEAATAGGSDVYLYQFTQAPHGAACQAFGAYHTLEQLYLYGAIQSLAEPPGSCILGPADEHVSITLQDAWSSFAAGGAPLTTPAWPLFEPETAEFLELRDPPVVGQDLRDGRCARVLAVFDALDLDQDHVFSPQDNCPGIANTNQADSDGDGIGDACEIGTPTPTPTVSPSPSAPPTQTSPPSPTATLTPICPGDCGRDGVVTIDEVILAVGITLGEQSVGSCSAADGNGNHELSVDELVQAINSGLRGCTSTAPVC